jgi:hypothetical protein
MLIVPRREEMRARFVGTHVCRVADRRCSRALAGSQWSGRVGSTKWYNPYSDMMCYAVLEHLDAYITSGSACAMSRLCSRAQPPPAVPQITVSSVMMDSL